MILFLSDPRDDYQDSIFYAFRKTFGKEVVVFPRKPGYFEKGEEHYRNCYYFFEENQISEEDIVNANKNNDIKAIFIISSGYDVHKVAKPLIKRLLDNGGKNWPFIVIDGSDGDRIQYEEFNKYPIKWDSYFHREYHYRFRHDPRDYDRKQGDLDGTIHFENNIYPLPFCVIPEKFPVREKSEKLYDIFFRGIDTQSHSRYFWCHQINQEFRGKRKCLLDVNFHMPVHLQDRMEYFNLIDSSKICLNLVGGGADCARFWELVGAEAFVCTEDYDQVVPNPYIDGIHLARFSNKQELIDKLTYYLNNDTEREKIIENCKTHTDKYHTCYARMHYIIEKIKENGWAFNV